MRLISRAALVTAAAIPSAVLAPAMASAVTPGDVSYSYSVRGSTVTNTIINHSGAPLTCGTSLAPAPGGVLPPVAGVIAAGQTLYDQGVIPVGTATQTVTDIPAGSYVVLATCSRSDGLNSGMWVSAYPGVDPFLKAFPLPVFTVRQASSIVSVPGDGPVPPPPGVSGPFGS
ncbi:hypothetical protein G4X40_06375 [Rhodococcus sp. D2-41]|uniref:Secreted protein n=1 Tax=Speluncibacter jeojiensis TaxID=2710754 RepID=A0A9X4M4X9_9ACTN|nr:hypothetical protein [Rhodococcus sp. D2-41]MDG3009770.1 hypothetical protein [Rhodococcus sp. D2-41]MDG3014521.1 hypothetical protein [Corynebacteriales bacterium D3-21]